MELAALVSYLDGYLRVAEVPDAPHAVNGLQVANAGAVSRVAAAVDLCEATVRMAAEQGADFLLVHHGLFWRGLEPLTGRAYRRVAGLIAKRSEERRVGKEGRGGWAQEQEQEKEI